MSDTAETRPGAKSLAEELRRRIAVLGPITVAEYMASALTHPRFGYYLTRQPFGPMGDFITAPDVSQMFGELVGAWLAHAWETAGRPTPVRIVELGPGRGALMSDALRVCRRQPGLAAAASVHLVEASPELREAQRSALAGSGFRLDWHGSLATVPAGVLLLVANEFFDALPVRQFQRTVRGWCERLVDVGPGNCFRYVLSALPSPAAALLPRHARSAPIGAVAETCPQALSLASEVGARVAGKGGAALIIDFGSDASGARETLQAVARHRPHDPLGDPGTADLCAHVDFEVLARSAAEAGARAWGPVPQGAFLMALGILERAAVLAAGGPSQRDSVRTALDRLVGAKGMGRLFRVLCLAHPDLPAPVGFEA